MTSEIDRRKQCTKRNSRGELSCTRRQQTGGFCKQHYILSMKGKPVGLVDATKTIEHINALKESGISQKRLAELIGIPQLTVWRIATGGSEKILASTEAKILAVPLGNSSWKMAKPKASIPNIGTQRRIRALMALGYPSQMIADRIGIHKRGVIKLSAAEQPFVWACTAKAVEEMYEEWRRTPGPSHVCRSRAAAKGWVTPDRWDVDEIDNPDAKPHEVKKLSFPERVAEYRELGYSDDEIAKAMGIVIQTLRQGFLRYKIPIGRRYRDVEDHLVLTSARGY